jgi:hypothetical protein
LPVSFTVACSAVVNAVLMGVVCGVPKVAAMLAGEAAVFDKENAAVGAPVTFAVTEKLPCCPLAVSVVAVATPLALVLAVVVSDPAKLPLAPDAGAEKVTVTPLTGLLPASFTVACRAVAKAVLMMVLCGVPNVVVMLAAGPATFVRLKLAEAGTPGVVAVTA